MDLRRKTANVVHRANKLGKKLFPRTHAIWYSRYHSGIRKTLSQTDGPRHYDSEEVFEKLQQGYPPRSRYAYDKYSTWERGTKRALNLLNSEVFREPGLNVLEAGCGDGMAGYALACYGHKVTLVDLEDWRDERAKKLPFVAGDLCAKLPLDPESHEVIVSYQTFEHLEDPAKSLAELVRICKTGGHIYLRFGPLYASPWGLHAYRTLHMPYPQFLFSETFINQKLQELGIYDLGQQRTSLQPLNRWKLSRFSRLWRESDCEIISYSELTDDSHLNLIKEYPKAFSGRELAFKDVVTQAISVMLRKR